MAFAHFHLSGWFSLKRFQQSPVRPIMNPHEVFKPLRSFLLPFPVLSIPFPIRLCCALRSSGSTAIVRPESPTNCDTVHRKQLQGSISNTARFWPRQLRIGEQNKSRGGSWSKFTHSFQFSRIRRIGIFVIVAPVKISFWLAEAREGRVPIWSVSFGRRSMSKKTENVTAWVVVE